MQIAWCHDVEAVVAKYGLKGPATRNSPPPYTPGEISLGVDRFLSIGVEPGTEPSEVERLAAHPEDFDLVYLAYRPLVCVVVCAPGPVTPDPAVAPAGSSFAMTLCCWLSGTAVTKTFAVPDGTVRVVHDAARGDERVPAGWGGSADDARGLYTVTVVGAQTADRMRFAVGGICRAATSLIGDGDNAIFGHVSDRLEVTFCGGGQPSRTEIGRFAADYGLGASTVRVDAGVAIYSFAVVAAPPDQLVRRMLADDRVRGASVIPIVPTRP